MNMDDIDCDWVVYKVQTTRSELEKNFKEYQLINNRGLERAQENGNNIYEVDTRESLLRDIEKRPKIQAEGFTHKCRNRKKMHVVNKTLPFDQKLECNVIYCEDSNVEDDVSDRLKIKAIENMLEKRQENKATSIEEIEIKCHYPTAKHNPYFESILCKS